MGPAKSKKNLCGSSKRALGRTGHFSPSLSHFSGKSSHPFNSPAQALPVRAGAVEKVELHEPGCTWARAGARVQSCLLFRKGKERGILEGIQPVGKVLVQCLVEVELGRPWVGWKGEGRRLISEYFFLCWTISCKLELNWERGCKVPFRSSSCPPPFLYGLLPKHLLLPGAGTVLLGEVYSWP